MPNYEKCQKFIHYDYTEYNWNYEEYGHDFLQVYCDRCFKLAKELYLPESERDRSMSDFWEIMNWISLGCMAFVTIFTVLASKIPQRSTKQFLYQTLVISCCGYLILSQSGMLICKDYWITKYLIEP